VSAKKGRCHLEWRNKEGKLAVRCGHQAPRESSKAYDQVTCGNCVYLVERDRIINDEKFRGYAESGYFPLSETVYNELVASGSFPKYGLRERDPITEQYMRPVIGDVSTPESTLPQVH
jgi:hypothetical protein